MQNKATALVVVCGLAAAAGGGIWVMRAAQPVEEPIPEVAPVVESEPSDRPPMRDVAAAPIRDTRPAPEPEPERPAPEPRAEETDEEREARRNEARERMREEALKRFDADGDGELSEDELAEARRQWRERANSNPRNQAMRQLVMRRYDADGDGELSREEGRAARDDFRAARDQINEKIIPVYDLDGDGELNREEREAARPAYEAEFNQLRIFATLDMDRSGDIDARELADAMAQIGAGELMLDLNGDGTTDSEDAIVAISTAQSGG